MANISNQFNKVYGQTSRVTKKSRKRVSVVTVLNKFMEVSEAKTGHQYNDNMKRSFIQPSRVVPRNLVSVPEDVMFMYKHLLKIAGNDIK